MTGVVASSRAEHQTGLAVLLLVAGFAFAGGAWWYAARRGFRLAAADVVLPAANEQQPESLERPTWRRKLTVGDPARFGRAAQWGVVAWLLALVLVLYLRPTCVAQLGVIAVAVLGIGTMSLVVGAFVVLSQDGGAPEIFWPLRARAAPVTTLLLLALLLAGLSADDVAVHGLRTQQETASPGGNSRIPIGGAFDAWLEDNTQCVVAVPGTGRTIRPMVLLAAEGGGVRAAYWTAAAVDRLWRDARPSCRRAAFLAGGASGGAVGLTVARFSPPGHAAEQVEGMSGPGALAAGAVGLFVRDTVYAATGVPAPTSGIARNGNRTTTGRRPWADRAALMEAAWEVEAPGLSAAFLDRTAGRGPSGNLVLTSTSVGTGCRMLISQLRLSEPLRLGASPRRPHPIRSDPTTGEAPDCADPRNGVAGSIDLLAAYAPPGERACLGPLSAANAAMLASRFPYVTPSAVLPGCGDFPTAQIVDGGYVENSGLGTLVDLAPAVGQLVREYNASRPVAPPIVPIVVYLDNGTGSDRPPQDPKVVQETLVPPIAWMRAIGQQNSTPTLLARLDTVLDPGRLAVRDPERLASIRRLIVVHQGTFPDVSAPLGWVLSEFSRAAMRRGLNDSASCGCADIKRQRDYQCRLGYGSMRDALALLGGRAPGREVTCAAGPAG